MKSALRLILLLALFAGAAPAGAQQPDYLTPEEIAQVRDTQEPDKRIALFLLFAQQRLDAFEKALTPPADQKPARLGELRDLLNDFIHAVDDTAAAVELPLERGGADLRKTRPLLLKKGEEFLDHLKQVQEKPAAKDEELGYDLEDATIAVQDLLELGKKIPEEPIPLKQPRAVESEEKAASPGKPTLKRRKEEAPPPPPPR